MEHPFYVCPRDGVLCDATPCLLITDPTIYRWVWNRTHTKQLKGECATSCTQIFFFKEQMFRSNEHFILNKVSIHVDALGLCQVCQATVPALKRFTLRNIHRWAKTLWPLTGEVNNIDCLVTMASVKGWDFLGSKWTVSSWSWCVGCRRNGQE